MTKCQRLDNGNKVGCFPDQSLIAALARVLGESDGVPQDVKILGKTRIPGELERPVSKFHGRDVDVVTSKAVVRVRITEA